MNRLVIVVAIGLSIAAGGAARAQELTDPSVPADSTVADGGNVVANDNHPAVAEEGPIQTHGDIQTGGVAGESIGGAVPPVPPPDLSRVPGHSALADSALSPTTESDDGLPMPPPAALGETTTPATTTADTTADDGTGTATGEAVPAPAPDNVATESDAAPATGPSCTDYTTWYDAQVAYETAGGTAADPALVAVFDPDYDGIACEDEMTPA